MSYIGAEPTTAAFPFDQFSGNGSTTAFTLTYAPASTTSIIVAISGVVQNPNTYSCVGTTLNFSPAPPTGTNNISVLYLGLPVIGVSSPGNTAYFSSTSFTATSGQTTFTPSGSYQVGFINVIRNGSQLAPADYTATNGTTVTLLNPCVAGDVVVLEVYTLTSISNALPLTGGTVTGATTFNTGVTVNGALASGFTGFKNRIINGGMVIDQRNNGASVTVNTSLLIYAVDRVYSFALGAAMSAQRVSSGRTDFPFALRLTGASGNTYAECGQRIESFNSADLVGTSVTVSFLAARSSGTSLTVRIYYANASDNFNSVTSIASQALTITSTLAQYTVTFNTLPSQVANGIQISFEFGALGSGVTATTTGVQLERGSNATSFEFRDYGRELAMCYRYYRRFPNSGSAYTAIGAGSNASTTSIIRWGFSLDTPMRTAPSASFTNCVGWDGTLGGAATASTSYTTVNNIDLDVTTSGISASVGRIAKVLMTSTGFVELGGAEL